MGSLLRSQEPTTENTAETKKKKKKEEWLCDQIPRKAISCWLGSGTNGSL
jgi:hypothetical protein